MPDRDVKESQALITNLTSTRARETFAAHDLALWRKRLTLAVFAIVMLSMLIFRLVERGVAELVSKQADNWAGSLMITETPECCVVLNAGLGGRLLIKHCATLAQRLHQRRAVHYRASRLQQTQSACASRPMTPLFTGWLSRGGRSKCFQVNLPGMLDS